MDTIHVYIYVYDNGFVSIRKRVWTHRTPQASDFLYSYKTKRYHPAMFYYFNSAGNVIDAPVIDKLCLRQALFKEGLDIR